MKPHIAVMAEEVLSLFRNNIDQDAAALFVDATLGAAGHASALLAQFPQASLIGFDQDACARELAEERLADFAERYRVIGENFREIALLATEREWRGADGILFDLGVSNMQITTPERGFSYQDDGPLDMRMNPNGDTPSAADLLETCDIAELTKIFRVYGEERHAYQIARAIVRARERGALPVTTGGLTQLIRDTLPAPVQRKMGTHPARRVFQALRIAVNGELDVLTEGIEGAYDVAADGAVIVVISYHSLEDRIVKRTFLRWAQEDRGRILTRRPLVPTEGEVEENRSARSAKTRGFLVQKSNQTRRCEK